VLLSANGYYFNETTNIVTPSQLQLNALTDITDATSINVNILTHLEKRRVEYLVSKNSSFSDAKKTAQKEILAIFGIQTEPNTVSEKMNIANDGDANAILLAISLIIQGNLSVGELSELLATISSDMEQDGKLNSQEVMAVLTNNAKALNLYQIRENLTARFKKMAVTAIIPNFEKYITEIFLKKTADKPTVEIVESTQFDSRKAVVLGIVNPNGSETAVTFEYGLTANYGSTVTAKESPLNGFASLNITGVIDNLDSSTTYHYRIKAQNVKGITYSADATFTTARERSSYIAPGTEVVIGTQTWMQRNLDVSKYRNGDPIPEVKDMNTWRSLKTGAYCYYLNDSAKYAAIYGKMYNWYAVNDPRGLAPEGWHIPTTTEWDLLFNFLGGLNVAGGKLRSSGTLESNTGLWRGPNGDATNSSGFYGQPSGYRYDNAADMGTSAFIWSSTEGSNEMAHAAILYFRDASMFYTWQNGQTGIEKIYGLAVRCVKNKSFNAPQGLEVSRLWPVRLSRGRISIKFAFLHWLYRSVLPDRYVLSLFTFYSRTSGLSLFSSKLQP
jgi:uncharacterized protein (TIGR02145 family)